MKIIMASVGKAHDPELRAAIEQFTKRLSHYFPCEWRLLPPAKSNAQFSSETIKQAEATTILNTLQKNDILILLDERGKHLTSPELADLIQLQANRSIKTVVFLIGGAYGVDNSVQQRANFHWSLSKLVFPHQIVRLVLAEQLYRACTILRNESYHHE
jgi:23S rRNA (pseudouridine1915-N3)-methyltransferase